MPIDASPRNAAHLWRRAAFGGSPDQIAATVRDGIETTVAAMFDERRAPMAGKPLRQAGYQAFSSEDLNVWFLRLAITSPTPAIERLMWFWHGHFATNVDKFENAELMHTQLTTLRRHGLGRFDDLLKLMARDGAMILWLDLEKSVVGAPNENYARELMELFSLGVDGGYTQADVVEGGRAFTGYSLMGERPPVVALNPALHDDGEKTILGQTGRFDGDDMVDIIVQRPECHRFIAHRLWTRYAGTEPAESVLSELAAAFARDLRIKDLLVAMFAHPAFYADDVIGGLVAQPIETTANALRGFGAELIDITRFPLEEDEESEELRSGENLPPWTPVEMLYEMGQLLAHPPNVGGWPHNEPWLDATRAAGRLNAAIAFAGAAVEFDLPGTVAIGAAARHARSSAVAELMAALGHVEWSAETEAAIGEALDAGPDNRPLETAIAVALTSPEVTLS